MNAKVDNELVEMYHTYYGGSYQFSLLAESEDDARERIVKKTGCSTQYASYYKFRELHNPDILRMIDEPAREIDIPVSHQTAAWLRS